MRWFDEVSRESLLRFDDRELDTQDLSGGFQEAELRERGNAVVKADLLQDFAVLDLENGCTSKVHFAARRCWQRSDEEIPECRPGMGAAPFPLPDDIVAFSNQIGCPPEIEIRERLPKILHEAFVSSWPPRGSCSEYFSSMSGAASLKIAGLAPEFGEPPTDYRLVI